MKRHVYDLGRCCCHTRCSTWLLRRLISYFGLYILLLIKVNLFLWGCLFAQNFPKNNFWLILIIYVDFNMFCFWYNLNKLIGIIELWNTTRHNYIFILILFFIANGKIRKYIDHLIFFFKSIAEAAWYFFVIFLLH